MIFTKKIKYVCTFLLLIVIGLVVTQVGLAQEIEDLSHAATLKHFLPLVSASTSVTQCTNCYFVDSVAGSDRNPGTSASRPWRSLAPIHATNFRPGSKIHFKRGSSWNGELFIDTSGINGNPITYTAYGTGAPPTFSNTDSQSSWTTTIFIDADWVVLDGLIVQNSRHTGVYIARGSDHNIVRNFEVTNVGEGIKVYGQYNLVTRNSIHDLHIIRNTQGGTDDYGAVGVVLSGSNNEISYNRLINCIAPSYDFGVDGGAIEWYDDSGNNFIHHNFASGNKGFLEVGKGVIRGARLAYNVSVNNGRFSLLNLSGEFASQVTDFRVENNTIVEDAQGERGWVIFSFEGNPTENSFSLRNNIIHLKNYQAVSNKATFSHDYNLYSLVNVTGMGMTPGQHELFADPKFVNMAGNDFHLAPTSPAINAGVNLGYSLDFENLRVPSDGQPDLGAFEFQAQPIMADILTTGCSPLGLLPVACLPGRD